MEISNDGREAIEKYKRERQLSNPFAAAIMGLTIPAGMDGKEAVKELLEIDPDAKVIVSSGYSTDSIMSEYQKYRFNAVVTKPFSVNQIEEILHNIMAER